MTSEAAAERVRMVPRDGGYEFYFGGRFMGVVQPHPWANGRTGWQVVWTSRPKGDRLPSPTYFSPSRAVIRALEDIRSHDPNQHDPNQAEDP